MHTFAGWLVIATHTSYTLQHRVAVTCYKFCEMPPSLSDLDIPEWQKASVQYYGKQFINMIVTREHYMKLEREKQDRKV